MWRDPVSHHTPLGEMEDRSPNAVNRVVFQRMPPCSVRVDKTNPPVCNSNAS